jgi:sugar lactone lactonase YvrE
VYENSTGASIGGLAVDSNLRLYVAEGSRLFVVDPPDSMSGSPGAVRALGPQSVGDPRGLAIDERRGFLYFADNGGARVRRVGLSTGTVETVAGTGRRGTAANQQEGIPALEADLGSPLSVAVAADGTIYFTDDGALRIRRVDAGTGRLTTVLGNGVQASAPDGAVAATSAAGIPRGVALDVNGEVLFTELIGGGKVRKVTAGGKVETLIRGLGDPFAAATDALGYYYVLDIGQRRITRHTPTAFAQGVIATAE